MNKVTKKQFLKNILEKYRGRYIVSLILMTLNAIVISFMPLIVNNIFDKAIATKKTMLLIIYIISYILLSLLYSIVDMNNSNLFAETGALVVKDMREKLCISISKKNGDYYTKLKTGDVSNRILAEVEYVESFISQNLFVILSDLFMLLGVSIVLFKTNCTLMSLVLLIQPIVIIIQNKYGEKSAELTRKFRQSYQNMCSATVEFLNNIMCIVFSHATTYYLKRYKELQEDAVYDAIKCQKNGNKSYFFQDIISNIIIIIIIGFGGYAVINNKLTLGELIAFNMYINKILGYINRLSKSYIKFRQFDVYLERLVDIINDSSIAIKTRNFTFEKDITFDEICFKYGNNIILNSFSMHINKGQKIAIVGESGSGKSTIINLLYALWDCESGKILIDDNSIDKINIFDLREKISIVSQNAFFYNDTFLNNITLGKEIEYNKVEKVCKLACIHDYITKLPEKYNTIIQESGKNLSGGQKQRLSIARALLNMDAEIFCFDEPTSAIDNIISQSIEKNFLNVLKTKTVLTITHKIASTSNYDYIYLIENGRVKEQGTFKELINQQGKFFKMYVEEKMDTEISSN